MRLTFMQFDFMPHSKLNLLRLLPPKSMLCFVLPAAKDVCLSLHVCVCEFVCLLVCVRFSNNFTLKFVTNCSYNENLHKISICVFVMLPLCPCPCHAPCHTHRFRFNFATICIKCAAARLTDKFHVSPTNL